jgi:hypothetical protein
MSSSTGNHTRPIGAIKQQHPGTALAGDEIADRNAVDVDRNPTRHRTGLLTCVEPISSAKSVVIVLGSEFDNCREA